MKALLPALCVLLGGCAVVNVHSSSNGDVEVTRGFGIVSVAVSPKAGAVIVESSGFGAMRSAEGSVLGYRSSTLAALPPEGCRLVIWIQTDEQLRELDSLVRAHGADLCVVRSNT